MVVPAVGEGFGGEECTTTGLLPAGRRWGMGVSVLPIALLYLGLTVLYVRQQLGPCCGCTMQGQGCSDWQIYSHCMMIYSYLLRLISLDHSWCDGRRCSSRRPFYTHVGSNQA